MVLNKSEIEFSSKVIAPEIVKHPAALRQPSPGRKVAKKRADVSEGQKGAAPAAGTQGCTIM